MKGKGDDVEGAETTHATRGESSSATPAAGSASLSTSPHVIKQLPKLAASLLLAQSPWFSVSANAKRSSIIGCAVCGIVLVLYTAHYY